MAPLTSTGASKPTYTAQWVQWTEWTQWTQWTQWTEWTQWVQRTQCKHIIYRTATIGGRARRVGRSGPIKGVCMDWYIKGYQSMHIQRGVHEALKRGVHDARYNSEGYMKPGTTGRGTWRAGRVGYTGCPPSPCHPSLLFEKLLEIAQTTFLLEFKMFSVNFLFVHKHVIFDKCFLGLCSFISLTNGFWKVYRLKCLFQKISLVRQSLTEWEFDCPFGRSDIYILALKI